MRAAQSDDAFFTGISINHQFLESWSNDFVFVGKQKNCRSVSAPTVRNIIKVAWDLQGHRSSQQPQIPPAELAEDHWSKRRWIVKDQASHGALRSYMQRRARPDACTKRNNRPIAGILFHRIKGSEGGGADSRQSRRSSAAAVARIIHSPNLNRTVIPHFCFGCYPALRAIGVPVETQNVNGRMAALLRDLRSCCPQLQFTVVEWNDLARRAVRIDRRGARKENEQVGEMREKHDRQI